MTDEKIKRMNELEKELAIMFENTNSFEERHQLVKESISKFFTGWLFTEDDCEDNETSSENSDSIIELGRLYDEFLYTPEEDEKTLAYLLSDDMSIEEKLEALADAWWYATNSGYSDAMANRLMAGEDSPQTQRWEENCQNKGAIDRYYKYLMESSENA